MTAKPGEEGKKAPKGSVQIEMENDWTDMGGTNGVEPNLIKANKDNVATITLSDCLACNGCVTTAETMLIQQHSVDRVETLLENCDVEPCVFSISQQSLYSLCALYETEPKKMFKVISQVLGSFGAAKVYDFSLATQFILNESYNEFLEIYTKSDKYQVVKECLDRLKGLSDEEIERESKEIKKTLAKACSSPVLCSECPGWVCYAEKVVGELAIPYMSEVKSPQQIQGRFIKKHSNMKIFCSRDQEPPKDIMHI
jgi:iron only hydrogenase large subunit-like protein